MTWVQIVAAIAVCLSFLTACLGLLAARRARVTAAGVQQIAVSVDGQMSGLLMRVDQLIEAMQAEGISVPAPPTQDVIMQTIKDNSRAERARHAAPNQDSLS